MSLPAARTYFADAAVALASCLESQDSKGPQSAPPGSPASPARLAQAQADFHYAHEAYNAALLAERVRAAVPGDKTAFVQQLKSLAADLRQPDAAAPENAATGHAGNRSLSAAAAPETPVTAPAPEVQQPIQQPDQPPKKKQMAHAIESAYDDKRRSTGFRFGLGALAGAGLTAGTFGLLGLGGLGFLGATAAVCGIASFGFLGAGLYAGYKYRSHLLPSYHNNFWQQQPYQNSFWQQQSPPSPSHGQNMGSWVPGSYLSAVQQSHRGHDAADMRTPNA
jgi:hypothetical protein